MKDNGLLADLVALGTARSCAESSLYLDVFGSYRHIRRDEAPIGYGRSLGIYDCSVSIPTPAFVADVRLSDAPVEPKSVSHANL